MQGRLPADQGFDEWIGVRNTRYAAGYSSYPIFHETGYPVPQIWEGLKGTLSQPVDGYNLETRATIDEKMPAALWSLCTATPPSNGPSAHT